MKNRIILKIRSGSHLYGLETPTSDEDFLGIYLSTPEELLGLQKSEFIDESIVSKGDDGRNDSDAVDCKYYSLQKFCQLALNANPSILEMLFADDKNIIECDEYGRELIENRDKFLSLKIKHSYIGYAFSQKQKSHVKSSNLRILVKARELLIKYLKKDKSNGSNMLYSDDAFANVGAVILTDENYPSYVMIADLKFNNQKLKDVLKKINERINRATHRADGMLEKGFDTKFISHTVRLLKEGEELLTTGKITFPLKDRELIMKIKLGEMLSTEVMDLTDNIEEQFENLYNSSSLPHSPDFHGANNMIINMYKRYLKESLC
jgi:predicted nucleotidyltransferase